LGYAVKTLKRLRHELVHWDRVAGRPDQDGIVVINSADRARSLGDWSAIPNACDAQGGWDG